MKQPLLLKFALRLERSANSFKQACSCGGSPISPELVFPYFGRQLGVKEDHHRLDSALSTSTDRSLTQDASRNKPPSAQAVST